MFSASVALAKNIKNVDSICMIIIKVLIFPFKGKESYGVNSLLLIAIKFTQEDFAKFCRWYNFRDSTKWGDGDNNKKKFEI